MNKIYETKNRDDFLQELQLRRFIREYLRVFESKRNFKILKEEKKLRTLINQIVLLEAKEDRPHHSTGINVLADLLKKIIPTLEIDYKKLTSNPKQRESFKNHILRAAQNTLTREKIEDEAGTKEGQSSFDQERNIKRQDSFDSDLVEAEINLGSEDEGEESEISLPGKVGETPIDKNLSIDPEQEKFIDVDRPSRKKNKEKKDPMTDFAIARARM